MNSILSDARRCYLCGESRELHKHHIFFGNPKRKLSEKYGCWVYLCPRCHNMSNEGVHFNHEKDIRLKQECQSAWEQIYGNREDFRKVFGRSYL